MDIKLTKADKVILKYVAFNPRITEKVLAKKCNLSKDSIRYRINRLEKLKVITGYGAFVDYTRLGYSSFKLYLKLNATFSQKQELVSFLMNQKHVFSIFESDGKWDVGMASFARDRNDYYEFENRLLSKFGGIIASKKVCLMLDAVVFNNNRILDDKVLEEHPLWQSSRNETIDNKDKILLHELHKNSKETLVNLAGKTNLSIDSVSKRIKKLNGSKIIPFYTTEINYNLLGFEKYKLFIYVKKYSEEFEKKLFGFLKTKKSLLNVIRMIGPWKLEVEFLIEKHDEFQKILSELQEKYSDYIQGLDFSIFRNDLLFPSRDLLL